MKSYYNPSKNIANSFLYILPLLVLYEVAIAIQNSGVKNTAGIAIKTPLTVFGKNGSLIFNLLVITLLFVSLFFIEKKYRFSSLIFIPMALESLVYALFIGHVLGFFVYNVLFPLIIAAPLSTNIWTGIVLSIGAGVYEEIVFRFLLLSALGFLFTNLLKFRKPISAIISIMISAFIFTTVHYLGALKDDFTYAGFTFRLLSAIFLSVIFIYRGLGIVVYTHAIYDVFTFLKPFNV